jgi:hypothetical protein
MTISRDGSGGGAPRYRRGCDAVLSVRSSAATATRSREKLRRGKAMFVIDLVDFQMQLLLVPGVAKRATDAT